MQGTFYKISVQSVARISLQQLRKLKTLQNKCTTWQTIRHMRTFCGLKYSSSFYYSFYHLFYSILFFFDALSFYPDVSLLPFFLLAYFSLIHFFLVAYIPQQNFSSNIKITRWLHSILKWIITINTRKNNMFPISLIWLNILYIMVNKNYL